MAEGAVEFLLRCDGLIASTNAHVDTPSGLDVIWRMGDRTIDKVSYIMNEAQTTASENWDYLSVSELAEMLGLHPATIRLWIREDRLPPVRQNGRRYLSAGTRSPNCSP